MPPVSPCVPTGGIRDTQTTPKTASEDTGGTFSALCGQPLAIIECKGITADLDHDKFNGRTPVQQLWDYLNELSDTPWGILSNYRAIRLYHRESPRRAFEEFTIRDFRDPDRVRQFLYLFGPEGLLGSTIQKPRARELIAESIIEQRVIGDDLYELYREARDRIIDQLLSQHQYTLDQARVLKRSCTAADMRPLADAVAFKEGVHKWNEAERAKLRAELDAAYFHLYGLSRDEVDFVLDQFQGVVKEDAAHGRPGPTRGAILEAYDAMGAE